MYLIAYHTPHHIILVLFSRVPWQNHNPLRISYTSCMVTKKMWEINKNKTIIRFGAAFLVRVGQLETQLYDACLGAEEERDAAAATSGAIAKANKANADPDSGDDADARGGGSAAKNGADKKEGTPAAVVPCVPPCVLLYGMYDMICMMECSSKLFLHFVFFSDEITSRYFLLLEA